MFKLISILLDFFVKDSFENEVVNLVKKVIEMKCRDELEKYPWFCTGAIGSMTSMVGVGIVVGFEV